MKGLTEGVGRCWTTCLHSCWWRVRRFTVTQSLVTVRLHNWLNHKGSSSPDLLSSGEDRHHHIQVVPTTYTFSLIQAFRSADLPCREHRGTVTDHLALSRLQLTDSRHGCNRKQFRIVQRCDYSRKPQVSPT